MNDQASDQGDPEEDPDFISDAGIDRASNLGVFSRGFTGAPAPVFVPKESTPLEKHDTEGVIPAHALWVLKYLGRGHFLGRAEATIRERYGSGVSTVYVVDDGRKHCLVSRDVGASPDGCQYCLVAQITIASYEQLVDNETAIEDIFVGGREFCLCVVYEAVDAVSNVAVVESFAAYEDVPVEYLPPSPALVFADSSE